MVQHSIRIDTALHFFIAVLCPSGQDSKRRVIPQAVAPTLRQPQLSSTGHCPGASAVLGSPVSQESGSGSTIWAAPPQSVFCLEDRQNAEYDGRNRSPSPSSIESVSSRRSSHLLHHALAAECTLNPKLYINPKPCIKAVFNADRGKGEVSLLCTAQGMGLLIGASTHCQCSRVIALQGVQLAQAGC